MHVVQQRVGQAQRPGQVKQEVRHQALAQRLIGLAHPLLQLRDPPLRLLLGRDVLKAMRDKIAAISSSIEEWKAVTKDVNFPGS